MGEAGIHTLTPPGWGLCAVPNFGEGRGFQVHPKSWENGNFSPNRQIPGVSQLGFPHWEQRVEFFPLNPGPGRCPGKFRAGGEGKDQLCSHPLGIRDWDLPGSTWG